MYWDFPKILEQILGFFARELSFELEYDVIRPEEKVILDTGSLRVRTIPLKHRVPTVGYVFEEDENSTLTKVYGRLKRTEYAMKNDHKLRLAGFQETI